MKRIFGLLSVIILVLLFWVCWKFQPWMSAGRSVQIGGGHFGDYDFQVWQRKNSAVTEPFTTVLFVRKEGRKWMPFMLDFEDTYCPSIALRTEGAKVLIFRGSSKLGFFSKNQETYTREPDGTVFPSAEMDSEPPGNWGVKRD